MYHPILPVSLFALLLAQALFIGGRSVLTFNSCLSSRSIRNRMKDSLAWISDGNKLK